MSAVTISEKGGAVGITALDFCGLRNSALYLFVVVVLLVANFHLFITTCYCVHPLSVRASPVRASPVGSLVFTCGKGPLRYCYMWQFVGDMHMDFLSVC